MSKKGPMGLTKKELIEDLRQLETDLIDCRKTLAHTHELWEKVVLANDEFVKVHKTVHEELSTSRALCDELRDANSGKVVEIGVLNEQIETLKAQKRNAQDDARLAWRIVDGFLYLTESKG